MAKRNAAEAMLSLLGYAKLLPPPPEKPALKRTTSAEEENLPTSGAIPNSETRRVKFDVNFIKDCIGSILFYNFYFIIYFIFSYFL